MCVSVCLFELCVVCCVCVSPNCSHLSLCVNCVVLLVCLRLDVFPCVGFVCLVKVCADVVVCLCLACFPDVYFRLWV